jgi:hypothetical protein
MKTCHKVVLTAAACIVGMNAATAAAPPKGQPAAINRLGGVSAPSARLAALIALDGSVVRSKGVASVTHPQTGVFCVKPSFSANVDTLIPTLTPEWIHSHDASVSVQYQSAPLVCPGAIAVFTLTDNGVGWVFADEAFTIVVP